VRFDTRELLASWFDIFPAHKKQREFVMARRRNVLALMGIGTGKTWGGVNGILRSSALNGVVASQSGEGLKCAILGRTGPDISLTLKPQFNQQREQFAQAVGFDPVWRENKTTGTFRMRWGGDIIFRPYDSIETVRGYTLASAYVDELDRSRVNANEALDVIGGRLRAGGTDPRVHRRLWVGTTPNGLQGAAALWLRMQRAEVELLEKRDLGRNFSACRHWSEPGDGVNPCMVCDACKLEEAQGYCAVRATLWDNTFLDTDTKAKMAAGRSARQYRQEIEGVILSPSENVFAEYVERTHVIDWQWDPELPYVLGVDWGTSVGYYLVAQVLTSDRTLKDGRVLPAGSWVVARENVMVEVSRSAMRRAIVEEIKSIGYLPYWAGADRAVREENNWLRKHLRHFDGGTKVETLKYKGEQRIIAGVEALRWMLEPYDEAKGEAMPPRLYLSRELKRDPTVEVGRGLRDALTFYGYERVAGELTNIPSRSPVDPSKHPIDALRYAVYTSREDARLHGGRPLPFTAMFDDERER
jgi:hypothetical protein